MLINTVPAGVGLRWLIEGARLLKRQPLGLPAMVVVYLMMLLIPAMIPLVGLAISGVLAPFATVGLMQCFRDASYGRAPSPAAFGQPFQDERQRINLFRLGMFNAGLLVLVALLSTLAAPAPEVKAGAPQTIEDLPVAQLMWQLVFYSPVLLLMWFAPLLAGWHGMTPGKAMFGSWVACWRNIGALMIYGVAALALTVAASFIAVSVVVAIVPSRELASLVLAPLLLVLMTIIQGSFYPMYLSVFAPQTPGADE